MNFLDSDPHGWKSARVPPSFDVVIRVGPMRLLQKDAAASGKRLDPGQGLVKNKKR